MLKLSESGILKVIYLLLEILIIEDHCVRREFLLTVKKLKREDLPTLLEMRLCTKCSSNTIENELQFLITCVKYDYDRQEILKLIDSKYHNFSTFNTEQKLLVEMEIIDLVGRFISQNM
jgi:hypothetical protein